MTARDDVFSTRDREQLEALFDRESGLPGWALLVDRSRIAFARAHRLRRLVAVVAIHAGRVESTAVMGPEEVAERFPKLLRPDDTIARVGASSYVVVCNDIKADADADRIAKRLVGREEPLGRVAVRLSGGGEDPVSVIASAIAAAQADEEPSESSRAS